MISSGVFLFLNGIGGGEVFVIFMVILLLFGSKRIPEFARGLGKGIRQFKDAANDIQRDIQDSVKDVKEDIDNTRKEIEESNKPPKAE